MPFENEIATGESLLALQKSAALRDFEGIIAVRGDNYKKDPPPLMNVPRDDWLPQRIIAIDGSNITHKVRNGFPGAEASLVMLSVVFIDASRLAKIMPEEIPSPRIFNEMDRAHTLDAVLPGANIVRDGIETDTSVRFFRKIVFDTLSGFLDNSHENLLDTLRDNFRTLCKDKMSNRRLPKGLSDWPSRVQMPLREGRTAFRD